MTIYIADTHALLWYLGGSPLLGSAARTAFDNAVKGADRVTIPAIVLAELIMLAEKRRAVVDINNISAILRRVPDFHLTALTPEVALYTGQLNTLPDIHDRLIVAEAVVSKAILITRDQLISSSGYVQVIWD